MNLFTTDRHRRAVIGLTIVAATLGDRAAGSRNVTARHHAGRGGRQRRSRSECRPSSTPRSNQEPSTGTAAASMPRPQACRSPSAVPGHDDLVLAAGEHVDGTPFNPHGTFATGTLETTLVMTIAMQLADEGVLDMAATVDRWLPEQSNADRVTLQMLLDGTSGWDGWAGVDTQNIVADLETVLDARRDARHDHRHPATARARNVRQRRLGPRHLSARLRHRGRDRAVPRRVARRTDLRTARPRGHVRR